MMLRCGTHESPGGASCLGGSFEVEDSFVQGGARAASLGAAQRKPVVRSGHETFLDHASDSLASSVAVSSQMLREVGPLLGDGGTAVAARRAASAGLAAARHRSRAAAAPERAPAAGPAPPPTPAHLPAPGVPPDRSARSARELFAALAAPAGAQHSVSVQQLQRGVPLVAPAPPLPFPGPGGLSPGHRRRLSAAAKLAAAGGGPKLLGGLPEGIAAMLKGVRLDLGELSSGQADPCSSFEGFLDNVGALTAEGLGAGGGPGLGAGREGRGGYSFGA